MACNELLGRRTWRIAARSRPLNVVETAPGGVAEEMSLIRSSLERRRRRKSASECRTEAADEHVLSRSRRVGRF